MQIKKRYLILAFAMVNGIALLYGISPRWFAESFIGVPDLNLNLIHILRAMTGLYMALGMFWLYAAFDGRYTNPAVLTTMIFAGGLVGGRLLSFLVDGLPSPLLVFYAVLELAFVPVGYWVYTRPD